MLIAVDYILSTQVMTHLQTKLSPKPPTLVLSNSSTDDYVWMVDGTSTSMATESVWVLEGASVNVEMDTDGTLKPAEMENILHEDLTNVYTARKILVLTEPAKAVTRMTTESIATTITTITDGDKKMTAEKDDPLTLVATGILVTLGVLTVAAGVVVAVWCMCRKFRSVNIFVRNLSTKSNPGYISRVRKHPRLIMVGSRVQPAVTTGPPATKIATKKNQE